MKPHTGDQIYDLKIEIFKILSVKDRLEKFRKKQKLKQYGKSWRVEIGSHNFFQHRFHIECFQMKV